MKELIESALEHARESEEKIRSVRGQLGRYRSDQGGEDTTEMELNRWEAERTIIPRIDAAAAHLERAVQELQRLTAEVEEAKGSGRK